VNLDVRRLALDTMSTDLIALFDVASDLGSPEQLRASLSANSHFAADLIAQYRKHWQPQTWQFENPPRPVCTVLYGPGGFALRFKPGILELYHMMPFSRFAADSSLRESMRRACRTLADLIGSHRVIFTHELMPTDGTTLSAIESSLIARIGPPATTYQELSEAEFFGPRSWLIDDLCDVSAS
jgi:hypothetical protein